MTGAIVLIVLTSLAFKFSWVILRFLVHAAMFGLMIVLVIASTCNPYVYEYMGWTPWSLIFGDHIYDLKKETHVQR